MKCGVQLALSLLCLAPATAFAGDQPPIIGDWCGIDEYVIYVRPSDISFHPMRGLFSPPAFDVRISDNRATYKQKYDFVGGAIVSCHLDLTDPMTAVETCDGDPDNYYPNTDEQAELKRCYAKPVPAV